MNNDQCIQIAEKVWKMDFNPLTKSYYYHHIGYDNTKIHIDDLEKEVLSWSGFGRTVEAMADRGYSIYPDSIEGESTGLLCLTNFKSPVKIDYDSLSMDSKLWRQAVHLAALDALK